MYGKSPIQHSMHSLMPDVTSYILYASDPLNTLKPTKQKSDILFWNLIYLK